jgi:hypothetical protein
MLSPGDHATFRPDILSRLGLAADYLVFTVLEVSPNPMDLARQVARVVDPDGLESVISVGLLVKVDGSR